MEWYHILAIVLGSIILVFLLSCIKPLYKYFFKRFYDFFLSLIAIVILSPIFIVLIIVGAVAMKGNPFFVQLRPGKISKRTGKEKIFKLIKFRSMDNRKDKDGNLLSDEIRLNKYGRLLRVTSLDELPELFNILKGNMSIVGPRPFLIRDMVFMTDKQRFRHSVKPGLTGLAQVNGRNNITWKEKMEYDIQYINKGIALIEDIKILIMTIAKVLRQSDVVRDGTESDIDYGDWLLKERYITKDEYDRKQHEAMIIRG